jgi:nicotinate dehydrogenase medium molybdopterin subunit
VRLRGRGLASVYFGIGNTGKPNPSSAFIEVHTDGSVSVFCGAADMGQGLATTLGQIVAATLGVPLHHVGVVTADTGCTPEAGVSSASRQTYMSGNACRLAAEQAREILMDEAARRLFCESKSHLQLEKGTVFVCEKPAASVTVSELVEGCRSRGQLVVGAGHFNPETIDLDAETGQGAPYSAYAFGSQLTEVEVDTETGEVTVIWLRAAHDVGRAINPQAAEGQIEGGVSMGLGFALMEEVIVERGEVLTKTFVEYMIPTALDIPAIESLIVEVPCDLGPFGAKGLGEPPACATAASVLNAVADATGVRIHRVPMTSESVFLALEAAGYRDGEPPEELRERASSRRR